MPNEMIDTAVRAAVAELERQRDESGAHGPWVSYIGGEVAIDGDVDIRSVARAVIASLREPSEAVLNAGDYGPPYATWTAMIDAILTEEGETR